jgi:hypothetical protein
LDNVGPFSQNVLATDRYISVPSILIVPQVILIFNAYVKPF